MQQNPLEQRTSALEDQVRDHGEVLDALADIARRQQQNLDTLAVSQDSHTAILQQLADMQEQTQSLLASHTAPAAATPPRDPERAHRARPSHHGLA